MLTEVVDGAPSSPGRGHHRPHSLLSGDDPAQTDSGDENTSGHVRYLSGEPHCRQEIYRLHDAISCRWVMLTWWWMVRLVHVSPFVGATTAAPGDRHVGVQVTWCCLER